jgi:hypothetical protein
MKAISRALVDSGSALPLRLKVTQESEKAAEQNGLIGNMEEGTRKRPKGMRAMS